LPAGPFPTQAQQERWLAEPPFSFVYGGAPSAELLADWPCERTCTLVDAERRHHQTCWSDPATGLVVRCEAVAYATDEALEWIVYLENGGATDTPIVEDLQAIDATMDADAADPVAVHCARGSTSSIADYQPLCKTVEPGGGVQLHSHGVPTTTGAGPSGSPSVEYLPFFNVQAGDRGTIVGLGWTGPWNAGVARRADQRIAVRAGMDRTHLRLHPGESIRGPRVLALPWQGRRVDAHNRWRRLLREHYSPRPGGRPFAGVIAQTVWGSWMDAEGHIAEIAWWAEHDIPLDCYWMDAGWSGDMEKSWVGHQSNRVANERSFPHGVQPVSAAAHRQGMKFLLWFVPESVQPDVEIGREHPEWLGQPFSHEAYGDQVFYGLDHGDPQVNQFMVEYFSGLIETYGVDIFRQDGLHLWPPDSGPDREGIRQIRYNEGFYAFWDGLLERHPELCIDNCGCGGRKLDLETIRRSVVLWRSDCQASGVFDPIISQAFSHGLSHWLPLHGAAASLVDLSAYSVRSAYACSMLFTGPGDPSKYRSAEDAELLRRLVLEYRGVRHLYSGDYYPLTPYSLDADLWLAWQFDRPDLDEGVVQAFRRDQCTDDTCRCVLDGLGAEALYEITDLDTDESWRCAGADLLTAGLLIQLPQRPGAAIFTYRRLD